MGKEEQLLLDIEAVRRQLYHLAKERSLHSIEVVAFSKELDELLNRLDHLRKNKQSI